LSEEAEAVMSESFLEKLALAIERNDSLLCVGLDPDPEQMPTTFRPRAPLAKRIRAFCFDIIERTASLACCYKPNIAFFEQAGVDGLAALRDVVAAVPGDIPVLLDAKRGDIGNTAKAYAKAAFEVWGADAVTVSPYLGVDSVAPFLGYAGKMVFVLCHTSNPSAGDVQLHGQPPLYQHIAREAQRWGGADQVGFVVGATHTEALAAVRTVAPDRWILTPGVGAQGGDLDAALAAGLDSRGSGMIVPVSRSVLFAEDPAQAALALRDTINTHRHRLHPPHREPHRDLILPLFEAGCIQFGAFTLASGRSSPIYIDLRRVMSFPSLFDAVVEAYSNLIRPLTFDRLAAVPYAALPSAAAIALRMRASLIYPRKEAKDHGTGRDVEGAFEAGQTAVVVEDVVTSGGSLLQAVSTMEAAGLEVRDIVVLVDREQGGRQALANRGYRLHAVLTLGEVLRVLHDAGKIDTATLNRVQAYLAG